MSKWRIWAGVLAVFFCGLVIGWVGGGIYHKYEAIAHFERVRKGGGLFLADMTLERLSKELDLTSRQRAQIRPLLIRGFRQVDEMMREHRPKIDRVMQGVAVDLKQHLTPAQKDKMDKDGAWRLLMPPPPGHKHRPPPPPLPPKS